MSASFEPPDILVLGGGGILGEAWMTAVLAGIEQASGWEARTASGFLGTSAGSIVAASLAAGKPTRTRGGDAPELPPAAHAATARRVPLLGGALNAGRAAGAALASPFATLGLRTAAPGGALARRAVLARVPVGARSLGGLGRGVEATGVEWDGRLLIAAVDLDSGKRVMFGSPGAPTSLVGDAVEASCAIPGYFRPVAIGGRHYVDGGAWSPTNMDAATVERGTRVLCLNPTGSTGRSVSGAVGVVSRAAAGVEALALRRRGAQVAVVSPDQRTVAAIGGNLMDPRPRAEVTAAGLEQGHRLARP